MINEKRFIIDVIIIIFFYINYRRQLFSYIISVINWIIINNILYGLFYILLLPNIKLFIYTEKKVV